MGWLRFRIILALLASALPLALGACTTAPNSTEGRSSLHEEVAEALTEFKHQGPTLETFLERSVGYAVFPDVGAGAIGIGGAYGKGELFEKNEMVGYCDLSQGTIGLQLGGQSYSEIVFFMNKSALEGFKRGQLAFDAAASAIAANAGASADADYRRGVAVFTIAQGGLMFQAAIGGQHFAFVPK